MNKKNVICNFTKGSPPGGQYFSKTKKGMKDLFNLGNLIEYKCRDNCALSAKRGYAANYIPDTKIITLKGQQNQYLCGNQYKNMCVKK